MAGVMSDSRARAEDMAESCLVEVEGLPALVDARDALGCLSGAFPWMFVGLERCRRHIIAFPDTTVEAPGDATDAMLTGKVIFAASRRPG
jgi:hypothetical protein